MTLAARYIRETEPSHILGMADNIHMIWVYAQPVSTQVVYFELIWNISTHVLPGKPMSGRSIIHRPIA